MRLRALLLLPLFVAACSHKPAPTIAWTNAHWGMLPSEVLGAVPEVAPESGDHLASGATLQFHLDAAGVAGMSLPAAFFFLDSRLVQINFGDARIRDNGANEKTLERLAASLRKQYGQETASRTKDPGLGLSRDTTWVAGDTEIMPVAIPVTASTSMVSVIYRRAAG